MRFRRYKVRGHPVETFREMWGWNWAELVCGVTGHRRPFDRKFGGELLCSRCREIVGHWVP